MSKFIIQGNKKLKGEIAVYGAKNAVLKILAASLLSDKKCIINNIPDIEDVWRMVDMMRKLGVKVKESGPRQFEVSTGDLKTLELDQDLGSRVRTSILLTGPLLARFGQVRGPYPGGDVIGVRPINFFLEGFRALGAEVEISNNSYFLKAKKLEGAEIIFSRVSVTATEALMMTAVLANGVTKIKNAAMEPEISTLADYLNQQGARIKGAGTSVIEIEGVKEISAGEFNLIPDRVETGTLVILGLATNSAIRVTHCYPKHLEALWLALREVGADLEIGADYILTKPQAKKFKAINITTHEYPGFITDLQAPFTVLMTQAQGLSLIHETIFEGRLFYTDELRRMGAQIIMCDPHRVIVNGPSELHGEHLVSPDIRAGIALIIAALSAQGESIIENIYQIDRGYEKIEQRLEKIGAEIIRVE